VPSLWIGEAGILLVGHRPAPALWQEERLLACANVANPTWELTWGSPGTMLAAQAMHARTGGEHWAEAWRESADRLWQEWRGDLWLQDLYGSVVHIVGPAHGFAGNVYVLARGRLLDGERRAELERRAVAAALKYAQLDDGLANGRCRLSRVPGCRARSAPSGATARQESSPHSRRSRRAIRGLPNCSSPAGELTWRAGPLVKGPGLCHGTAGNGYAFLKLFQRTEDDLWLDRARVRNARDGTGRADPQHKRPRPLHALDRRRRDSPLPLELHHGDSRSAHPRQLLSRLDLDFTGDRRPRWTPSRTRSNSNTLPCGG
jgi:hypothetical protein